MANVTRKWIEENVDTRWNNGEVELIGYRIEEGEIVLQFESAKRITGDAGYLSACKMILERVQNMEERL